MADELASRPDALPSLSVASSPALPTASTFSAGKLLLAVMFGGFMSGGLLDGGGGVLWPEVTEAFRISDGLFGLAGGLGLLVAFPIMLLAGQIADRFDKRSLLMVAFLGFTAVAALLGLASAGGALLLIAILALRGFSASLIDLGNNAIAIEVERSSGRHILGPLHAMYSAGTLVGALGVWGIFALGGGFKAVYLLFTLCFLTLAVMAWRARSRPFASAVRTAPVSLMATLALLRRRDIRLLGLVTALGMFGGILFSQWAGIYLDKVRAADESARVLAMAMYGGMMVIGRLMNGRVLRTVGVRAVLVADGVLTAAAGMLVSLDGPIWLAVVACGLGGLGVASIVPLTISTCGTWFPREGAEVPGAVLLIGYVGLAGGPLIAGLVASLVGATAVMQLATLAGLLIVLVASLLRQPDRIH